MRSTLPDLEVRLADVGWPPPSSEAVERAHAASGGSRVGFFSALSQETNWTAPLPYVDAGVRVAASTQLHACGLGDSIVGEIFGRLEQLLGHATGSTATLLSNRIYQFNPARWQQGQATCGVWPHGPTECALSVLRGCDVVFVGGFSLHWLRSRTRGSAHQLEAFDALPPRGDPVAQATACRIAPLPFAHPGSY